MTDDLKCRAGDGLDVHAWVPMTEGPALPFCELHCAEFKADHHDVVAMEMMAQAWDCEMGPMAANEARRFRFYADDARQTHEA